MFQHTAARRRLRLHQVTWSHQCGKFQHTAARRRLLERNKVENCFYWFQHTAARRRLLQARQSFFSTARVSTHSRAEAAAYTRHHQKAEKLFQHTAARRRLQIIQASKAAGKSFNTQPRGGGCSHQFFES